MHHFEISNSLIEKYTAFLKKQSKIWSLGWNLCYDELAIGEKMGAKNCLDLHGFKLIDVDQAVDDFLRKAEARGVKQIQIMPGKGGGVILKAVQTYLKRAGYPFRFALDKSGKENQGVLDVFME